MVLAAAVNRCLGSRTGSGRVSRELPTEPGPPRALKPPFSRSREKGRFRHGLLDQIGEELRVQYVLEGSVRRAGARVRVTAQLIKVGEQTHVWAESYDRDLRDILAL